MARFPVSPAEVNDSVPDPRPDTIGTPEGDNEYLPDEPLPGAANIPTPDIPRGNEPHPSQPIRPAEGV